MTESEFKQQMLNQPRDAFFPIVEESPLRLFVSNLASGNYAKTSLSGMLRRASGIAEIEDDTDVNKVLAYQDQMHDAPRRVSKALKTSELNDVFIHGVWVYTATGVLCDTFVHSDGGPYWEPKWEGESFFCSRIPKFPGPKGHTPYQFQEEFVLERPPPSVVWWWERLSGLEMKPMLEYLMNKDLSFSQLADLLTVGAPWAS